MVPARNAVRKTSKEDKKEIAKLIGTVPYTYRREM
jgi:hypothetical protein